MAARAFVAEALARQGIALPEADVDFLVLQLDLLERMAARLRPSLAPQTPAHGETA